MGCHMKNGLKIKVTHFTACDSTKPSSSCPFKNEDRCKYLKMTMSAIMSI